MAAADVIVHADLPGLCVVEHRFAGGMPLILTKPVAVYVLDGHVDAEIAGEPTTVRPGHAVAAAEMSLRGSGTALVVTGQTLAAKGIACADTDNHYAWGAGCDGWRLLEQPSLSIREERMPPGTAEQPHVHARASQLFYVLSGRPSMGLADREQPLAAGESVTVPAGHPHQMRNHGPGDATFLAISAPATDVDRTEVDVDLVAPPAGHVLPAGTALLVVDVQQTFLDPAWGSRNNPGAEANVARLLAAFRAAGRPVVHVHHRNTEPGRRFHPDTPGHAPQAEAAPIAGEPVVPKTVNSAFIGTDLHQRLQDAGVTDIVICGLTTDHCVSTTTRMAANLGYRVHLAADACATFDRTGPDGRRWSAQDMHDVALASLDGEFAAVVTTAVMVHAVCTS